MRKHQQRIILELLGTMKEAHTVGLYADCQDGALSVGEFIEDNEGEGTKTVSLLEEYCDLLFQASNGEVSEKQLNKHLVKVENSVKSELKPNRIEVAFLSYKASMSDSLETIYLTAKADPSCDAYWIPIPYYERRPDGSVGAMHIEGKECYSDKFECTDWQKYNVEARHPEAIFTFSPYDDTNLVTSVHPAFYCERLRNLTDMLVYVPYFVSADNVSKHFCIVAGCLYAHKVFVQSENIRSYYIQAITDEFGSKLGNPKDKFVALGTPKFDKVINSKREDFILPDNWQKLIADKKVVFYNSTVGAILKGNTQYLTKLRQVIDYFRNIDDIILWWRPHPLGEATFTSMRPQLLDEYKEIISEYINDGWGIYDDTPDLHRAIMWTDAYYGDGGSVWVLYATTGKSVMIQNPELNLSLCDSGVSGCDAYLPAEQIAQDEPHLELDRLESSLQLRKIESESCDLRSLIAMLRNGKAKLGHSAEAISEFLNRFISASDGTAGQRIYRYVCDMILGE